MHRFFQRPQSITRRQTIQRLASIGLVGSWILRSPGRALACPSLDENTGYRISLPSMGSIIDIRWIASEQIGGEQIGEREVVEAARQCADTWVDVLSDYEQDSECMRLCRDGVAGDWVSVSDSLWRVLLECDTWHRVTEGAFDAALGALTRLRRSSKVVPENAWVDARARCGWEHLELDGTGRRVRFRRPGVMLDFGAIGKGFVVDRIGDCLRTLGIDRFIVNASGNMLCGDPVPSKEDDVLPVGWPVAIGVLGEPDRELKRVRLSCCGIATSGDQYQRYRDDGSANSATRSSHIVDPLQRRGLEQPNMATVITANASDADAMATACCVHLQRGTLHAWLSRAQSELPPAEYVFQSWRDGGIAYTSIPCDW